MFTSTEQEIAVLKSHPPYKRSNVLAPMVLIACTVVFASALISSGQVTIDFWNPDTGEAVVKVLQDDIQAFEKEHPGIRVNLVNIPWNDIYTKWQTGVQSGNLPDASIASAAFGATFNAQGALEPLDDLIKEIGGEAVFAPSAKSFVEMCKQNGSFFDLPYVHNAVVLWYVKDLLKKAGVAVPQTWPELLAAAKALTKDGVYGILMTSSKDYVTQHTFYSLMLSNGADIVDRETGQKVVFDSPETVETLKFYKELAQYSPPGAGGYDRPQAQAAMTTGKIAMFIYGSWLGGALSEAGPDVLAQFGVAPVPQNKGKGAFMGNLVLMVFKAAKHKAEAKEFLAYLMKNENYVRYLLTDPASYGPVTVAAKDDPAYKNSPQVKAVQNVIDAFEAELPNAWVYAMPNPHAGELEGLNVIAEVVGRVVLENVSPEVAARDGATKIQEIIEKK
jgi:multiple sugar transport system substrate-binding protein